MNSLVTFIRIIGLLLTLFVFTMIVKFTNIIVDFVVKILGLEKNLDTENIIVLFFYLFLGSISLIMLFVDERYNKVNFEPPLWRRLISLYFNFLGIVSIFFVLLSIYLLVK
ncbi:MAG: hypothetical protein KGZ81_11490 [Flavobacteriales bacterium]|nr:hypothetical protein [Flavobacteriales bacterium]